MFTFNCKGRLLVINEPVVMGIINVTPDSFYAGSRRNADDEILKQASKMIEDGAAIIDIGGQSTRPGSDAVSAAGELERVLPAIEAIRSAFPRIFISVDTFYSGVAQKAVLAGADIVNDISGGELDMDMLSTVARLGVPYVCMHMRGTPETMQQFATYSNVALEVLDYFIKRIETCRLQGINDVIVDPGFGFAKTIDHNFELLRKLDTLSMLEKPVLAGLSRKGTIYKTLGITAEEALNGTTVLNTIALSKGASILRVHDVKEAVETIKLVKATGG